MSAQACAHCLASGGRILLAENEGSAAQAQHIACELVGRLAVERRGLAAIALGTDAAVTTALGNDLGFEQVFARQVEALGRAGDVLMVFSTSGNSLNILRALEAADAAGLSRIAFGGGNGGAMAGMCELLILVPSSSTPRIQEAHLLLGHVMCESIEARLFAATGYADD